MVYVLPQDALFYSLLFEYGESIYESQDGLTCHKVYGSHTYEMQLEEVGNNIFILKYIKEVS